MQSKKKAEIFVGSEVGVFVDWTPPRRFYLPACEFRLGTGKRRMYVGIGH